MNPWGDVFHCFPVPEGPCGGPSQESHGWSSFPIIIPFEIPGALESWSLGQENTSSIATLAISVLGSHIVRIYFWDGPWEYPVIFSLFGSYFNASEPMVRVELSNSERFQGPVETLTSVPSTLWELRKMGCIMHGPFHSARSAGGKNDATFVFFGEGVGFLERGPAETKFPFASQIFHRFIMVTCSMCHCYVWHI